MPHAELFLALELAGAFALIAATFTVLVWLGLAAWEAFASRRVADTPALLGGAFTFAILGLVIGSTLATSRTPAVDAVLPGILTFVGAVAAYLVTRTGAHVGVATVATVAFALHLFMGSVLGALQRGRAEAAAFDPDRLRWQADVEFTVNAYRDALGLAPLAFPGVTTQVAPAGDGE
jgi:hypothetical protein